MKCYKSRQKAFIFTLIFSFTLASCLNLKRSGRLGGGTGSIGGGDDDDDPVAPPADSVAMTFAVGDATANAIASTKLAEQHSVAAKVTAGAEYNGPVDITFDKATIDNLDVIGTQTGTDQVQVTVTPQSVTLSAGESADITVTINVRPGAPAFGSGTIGLIATAGSSESRIDVAITMPNRPRLEVREYVRAANADWRLSDGTMVPQNAEICIAEHAGGVDFVRENWGAVGTVFHSGANVIPHGSIGNPLAASADPGNEVGGVQLNVMNSNTPNVSDRMYNHDTEMNANARIFEFNSDGMTCM